MSKQRTFNHLFNHLPEPVAERIRGELQLVNALLQGKRSVAEQIRSGFVPPAIMIDKTMAAREEAQRLQGNKPTSGAVAMPLESCY